jgi:menaquinone-9 beta-reductase
LKTVIVIGGGIAGLITSTLIARSGIGCILFEKRDYPHHRVCGEYISNEALPFLKSKNLYPDNIRLPTISRFMLSSVSGKNNTLPLDLGGFGVSRYFFDSFLLEKAREAGVEIHLNTSVENVRFTEDKFVVETLHSTFKADVVLGSFGKRSNLDTKWERDFVTKRSPYVGVKYHLDYDYPSDLIALHNFPGGYCGISCVENNKVNLCYLVHREKLREYKSIRNMEENVLMRNPFLKKVFTEATFLFDKPETINEISFERKLPVENHILMIGDAAGLITPLCGNGMAMAIHSAKIASEKVIRFAMSTGYSRSSMENEYASEWTKTFSPRLFAGRQLQKLFGSELASNVAVNLALYVKPVALEMIRKTHGRPFE